LAKFTASEKVQKLREPEQFVFTFHTYNLPLPVHKPVYMTSMTYGVYLILSVVLTILPTRFGTQIMLEKIQGTKHAMIVMGLPIADYWFGNFAINYIAMLFGNFLMSLCIAYFFSLFRSYILIPILICALFHSAAVLLYAYFLSHCFSTIKSYTNALQLSTFILSLAPAYFVSIFADITDSDREWNYLVKMIHLVSSLLLPQYNPIGSLLGCAIIEEKYKRLGKKPKLSDFFLFEHLPIWNVIGSAAQAVILYGAIIWVDYVSYSFKKCSKKNRELLKHLYERKVSLKMTCTNSLAANLSLIQEYLKNEKDLGVLFEEQECQKLSDALLQNNVRDETIIQEEFFLKKSNLMREDNKSSVHMFPLVLMHNIHYLSPANCTKQYPIVPLKGLSLRVYRGEIMGIVGPKGAGKTTCLSLLSCYPTTPAPTRGKAFIGGYDVCKHATKVFGHLGVCPQHEALWHDISVRENIEILSRIKLISKVNQLTIYYKDREKT
jgi:ABC-type multidrug transport system fused ATPase/permease subunit